MTKLYLAGFAVAMLTSTAAFAQVSSSTTATTTTQVNPSSQTVTTTTYPAATTTTTYPPVVQQVVPSTTTHVEKTYSNENGFLTERTRTYAVPGPTYLVPQTQTSTYESTTTVERQ